jgi:hypothetical protein
VAEFVHPEMLSLRDGLIVRWEYYWERAEALEAAGVDE